MEIFIAITSLIWAGYSLIGGVILFGCVVAMILDFRFDKQFRGEKIKDALLDTGDFVLRYLGLGAILWTILSFIKTLL